MENSMTILKNSEIARITVAGLPDHPGSACKVLRVLGNAGINVDIVLQSVGKKGTSDISLTVARSDADRAVDALEANAALICFDHVSINAAIAKVTVHDESMANKPGVAASTFEALYDEGINIDMISTSEIQISVVIDAEQMDKAAAAIAKRFAI